jgi:mRNA interferase HigB
MVTGGSGALKPNSVHVISKSAWREVVAADPALEFSINAWHKIATDASWSNIADVKRAYPHADFVDSYTVFNIKGNTYRLIVKIEYRWQMIFVKHVLTHDEYGPGVWK